MCGTIEWSLEEFIRTSVRGEMNLIGFVLRAKIHHLHELQMIDNKYTEMAKSSRTASI